MNKSKEILKLENINLSYDNKKTYVLKDISFSVFSGEILSIIGVNGSGKSSLLKVIAGIQKIDSGKIIKNYKSLSYVPQKISLDKSFPILVSEFIKSYNTKKNKKDIISYLEKFDAQNLLNKKVGDLSGGQLQKVLIISALISKPEIILLDEPTAGIDIIGEEVFYEIIKEVKELFPELSIIIVSHNIKLVYKNSDKVICLHENNFCCHGTPLKYEDIKNSLKQEVGGRKDFLKGVYENVNDGEKYFSNEKIRSLKGFSENIFGKYTLPYKHNPHNKNNHKNI